MARCPSLDDYDNGNGGVYWAERIFDAARPAYDRASTSEVSLARTRVELRADAVAQAATAAERYAAHRERARVLEVEARAAKEVARKRQADLEAERRHTFAAHAEKLRRDSEDIQRRRAQWEAEHSDWASQEAEERARRKAIEAERMQHARREHERQQAEHEQKRRAYVFAAAHANMNAHLGEGAVVRIIRKNINIGIPGGAVRLEIGEFWVVGPHWWGTLINDGYAEHVA